MKKFLSITLLLGMSIGITTSAGATSHKKDDKSNIEKLLSEKKEPISVISDYDYSVTVQLTCATITFYDQTALNIIYLVALGGGTELYHYLNQVLCGITPPAPTPIENYA